MAAFLFVPVTLYLRPSGLVEEGEIKELVESTQERLKAVTAAYGTFSKHDAPLSSGGAPGGQPAVPAGTLDQCVCVRVCVGGGDVALRLPL